ncbi:MAG: PDDEXK nuclease domain-containing protein [Dysgonamonadaceae bacterium]|jgi:predicted nuclease of restriction endonuclease-like (RecB) superfamily|nr:PDDEXK nuclease domain-containing protein [Dysgonamonadaceae bacterium]
MEVTLRHTKDRQYDSLIQQIALLVGNSKKQVATAINSVLVETYWNIGKYIVEFEQDGKVRANYGDTLLINLSKDLTTRIGKGFSKSNLFSMRMFYIRFPIFQTLSGKLSWSHIIELINIDNELERNFYLAETASENWSVRELRNQKERGLFIQLALGKNKEQILALARSGNRIEAPEDIIKDTYTLDFLNIPEQKPSESALEDALIENIEHFLLELGKGFAFVGRQYRLTVNNTHYYADLVFYHIILRCYVVIDLKTGKVKQEDIGQMNLYLGYFAIDKNNEGDNPPIGIILAREKDEIMVQYAMYGNSNQLFVSKYQMYLPDLEELRNVVFKTLK